MLASNVATGSAYHRSVLRPPSTCALHMSSGKIRQWQEVEKTSLPGFKVASSETFGDSNPVGETENRFWSWDRVYFGRDSESVVILLCGGSNLHDRFGRIASMVKDGIL
jgi:hypothetical protein